MAARKKHPKSGSKSKKSRKGHSTAWSRHIKAVAKKYPGKKWGKGGLARFAAKSWTKKTKKSSKGRKKGKGRRKGVTLRRAEKHYKKLLAAQLRRQKVKPADAKTIVAEKLDEFRDSLRKVQDAHALAMSIRAAGQARRRANAIARFERETARHAERFGFEVKFRPIPAYGPETPPGYSPPDFDERAGTED